MGSLRCCIESLGLRRPVGVPVKLDSGGRRNDPPGPSLERCSACSPGSLGGGPSTMLDIGRDCIDGGASSKRRFGYGAERESDDRRRTKLPTEGPSTGSLWFMEGDGSVGAPPTTPRSNDERRMGGGKELCSSAGKRGLLASVSDIKGGKRAPRQPDGGAKSADGPSRIC